MSFTPYEVSDAQDAREDAASEVTRLRAELRLAELKLAMATEQLHQAMDNWPDMYKPREARDF